jgi:gluconate 2-dehydrogenase gamma chain
MAETPLRGSGDEVKATTGTVVGRRQALQLLGSLGVAGGLAAGTACHSSRETSASVPVQAAPRTLAEPDFALLSQLTALIIPKTDTAGALEAGVPDFIDASLPTMSGAQLAAMSGSADVFSDNPALLFADGLHWIDEQAVSSHGNTFLKLDETDQLTFLVAAYAAVENGQSTGRSAQFLRSLKSLTVDAYYTSQDGLLKELGYKGNTPRQMSELDCKSPIQAVHDDL